MKHEEFKTGMQVKMKDPDDGKTYTGFIVQVTENSVVIQWPDITEPVEHFSEEFGEIHPANRIYT